MNIRSDIRGTALFYTLVTIPIAFSLSIITVDVSGWNALRDFAQREADRIAIQATQALPNTDAARNIVLQATQNLEHGLSLAQGGPLITTNSVSLSLEGSYDLAFSSFVESSGNSVAPLRVLKSGTAQLVPTDYSLIISDSHRLRPQAATAPWGNPAWWPASGYFSSCIQAPQFAPGASEPAATLDWNNTETQRWLTQSCFNPAFSAVKQAAISIVDAVGAVETNRVAVFFTPGNPADSGVTALRYIHSDASSGRIGGFPSQTQNGAQSRWPAYTDTDYLLGDESCFLFSNPGWDLQYALEVTPRGLPQNPNPGASSLSFQPCGDAHFPYGWLSAEYLQNTLLLREAIYWHSAKLPSSTSTAEPDIVTAVRRAALETHITGFSQTQSDEAVRGSLAHRPQRKIIVLAETLPDPSSQAVGEMFDLLRQAATELILVGFDHPDLSSTDSQILQNRIATFRNLEQQFRAAHPEMQLLRVYSVNDPRTLTEELVPRIIGLDRTVVLRS